MTRMGTIELLLRAPTLVFSTPAGRCIAADHLVALPSPFILALDDYHVIKAPEFHSLMARLIEHLPAARARGSDHTGRSAAALLDRLRGRQQLGETRAADLRFSTEETRLLLQRMLGAGGRREKPSALLEDSTEGWAVGLHLAALSLRNWQLHNRSDPARLRAQDR